MLENLQSNCQKEKKQLSQEFVNMAALPISLGPRLGAIVDGSAVLNTYDISDRNMSSGPSVQIAAPVEHVAWSATGTYAVVADANGGLNFVLESGKLLFRHALVKVESGV